MKGKKRGRKRARHQAVAAATAATATAAATPAAATAAAASASTSPVVARNTSDESKDQPRRKRLRRTVGSPVSGAVPRSKVTMAQLPDVVQMLTFSFLDEQDKGAVARICSKWRNLVYSRSLWRDVIANLHLDTLTSADLASLEKRGIQKILVQSCTKLGKIEEIILAVPMLQAFDALCVTLNERRLKSMFFPALSNMRSLKLRMLRINAEVCKHIAEYMVNLEELELKGPHNVTILSDIGTLKQVKMLAIDSSSWPGICPLLPPQTVEMPCLREFTLWGAILCDAHLNYLKGAFPKLKQLEVDLCSCERGEKIGHLAELNELDTLSARNFCGAFPFESTSKLKNLHVLDLYCTDISSADLKFLGQLPDLEQLWLTLESLQQEEWRCFSQGFPKLEILSFRNLSKLSKRDAKDLGKLPRLKEIEIQGIEGEFDIQGMCQTLHKLESLTLGCRLTDANLRAVAQMPSLKFLDLRESKFDCEGLRHLSEGKAPLRVLCLDGTHFTSQGLLHLADGPQTLRELEVHHSNDFVDGLPELLQRNQTLRTVRARMTANMKRTLKKLKPDVVIQRIHS